MNCERAQEQFSPLQEGSITPALRLSVENHIKECSECNEGFSAFNRSWELLGSFEEVETPFGLHDQIMARIDADEWARKRAQPSTWMQIFNKVLIAGGIACALGFFWLASHTNSNKSTEAGFVPVIPNAQPVPKTITPPSLDLMHGSIPIIRLSGEAPLDYVLYITDDASKFDSANVKSNWSGTVRAGNALDIPLGTAISLTEGGVIWLSREDKSGRHLSLFLIPGTASAAETSTAVNATLSSVLQAVGQHHHVAVLVEELKDNPTVIMNSMLDKPEASFEAALKGTTYHLSEIKGGVAVISPN